METKQTNYTIAEQFELPSKGLIYGKANVPAMVQLRSMTGRDEMKLLSPATIAPHKVLADIIDSCLIEKLGVSAYDMAYGDYEFLMHKLRVVTFGPQYNMQVICPYCGRTVDTNANLDELKIKPFDIAKFNELKTITLPVTQRLITLKYKTPRMADNISIKVKKAQEETPDADINFAILFLLTSSIDTVDGVKQNYADLETFVFNLPAKDLNYILSHLAELNDSIGLDTTLTIECTNPKCKKKISTFFRAGPEFLSPTVK